MKRQKKPNDEPSRKTSRIMKPEEISARNLNSKTHPPKTTKLSFDEFKSQSNVVKVLTEEIEANCCNIDVETVGKRFMKQYFKGKGLGSTLQLNCSKLPDPCTYEKFRKCSNVDQFVANSIKERKKKICNDLDENIKNHYYTYYLKNTQEEFSKEFPKIKIIPETTKRPSKLVEKPASFLAGNKANAEKHTDSNLVIESHPIETPKLSFDEFKSQSNVVKVLTGEIEANCSNIDVDTVGKRFMKQYFKGKGLGSTLQLNCSKLPDPCTYEKFRECSNVDQFVANSIKERKEKICNDLDEIIKSHYYTYYLNNTKEEFSKKFPKIKIIPETTKRPSKLVKNPASFLAGNKADAEKHTDSNLIIESHPIETPKLSFDEFKSQSNVVKVITEEIEANCSNIDVDTVGKRFMNQYFKGKGLGSTLQLNCSKLPNPCTYEKFRECSNIDQFVANSLKERREKIYNGLDENIKSHYYTYYLNNTKEEFFKQFPEIKIIPETPKRPRKLVQKTLPFLSEKKPASERNATCSVLGNTKKFGELTFKQFQQETNVLQLACVNISKIADNHFASIPETMQMIYKMFENYKTNGKPFPQLGNLKFFREWENRVPDFEEFQSSSNVKMYAQKLVGAKIEFERGNRDNIIREIFEAYCNGTDHKLLSELKRIDVCNPTIELEVPLSSNPSHSVELNCDNMEILSSDRAGVLQQQVIFIDLDVPVFEVTVSTSKEKDVLDVDSPKSQNNLNNSTCNNEICPKECVNTPDSNSQSCDMSLEGETEAAKNCTEKKCTADVQSKNCSIGTTNCVISDDEEIVETSAGNWNDSYSKLVEDTVGDNGKNDQLIEMYVVNSENGSKDDNQTTGITEINSFEMPNSLPQTTLEPDRIQLKIPIVNTHSAALTSQQFNSSINPVTTVECQIGKEVIFDNVNFPRPIGEVSYNQIQALKKEIYPSQPNSESHTLQQPNSVVQVHTETNNNCKELPVLEPANATDPQNNQLVAIYARKILRQQFEALRLKLNSFDDLLKVNMQCPPTIVPNEMVDPNCSFQISSNIVQMHVDINVRGVNENIEHLSNVEQQVTDSTREEAFEQFLHHTNIVSLMMAEITRRFPNEPHRFLSLREYIYRYYKKIVEGSSTLPVGIALNSVHLTTALNDNNAVQSLDKNNQDQNVLQSQGTLVSNVNSTNVEDCQKQTSDENNLQQSLEHHENITEEPNHPVLIEENMENIEQSQQLNVLNTGQVTLSQDLFSNSTTPDSVPNTSSQPNDLNSQLLADEGMQLNIQNIEFEPMQPLHMSDEEEPAINDPNYFIMKEEVFSDYGDDVTYVSPEKTQIHTIEESPDWLNTFTLAPIPAFDAGDSPLSWNTSRDGVNMDINASDPLNSNASPHDISGTQLDITVVPVAAETSITPAESPQYCIEFSSDSCHSNRSSPIPLIARRMPKKKNAKKKPRSVLNRVFKRGVKKRCTPYPIEDCTIQPDTEALDQMNTDNTILAESHLMPYDVSTAKSLDSNKDVANIAVAATKSTETCPVPSISSSRVSHLANKKITDVSYAGSPHSKASLMN